MPETAKNKDIGVLVDFAMQNTGTPPTAVVPAGWNEIINQEFAGAFIGPSLRLIVSSRKLGPSEGGTAVTGMDDNDMRKTVLIFRQGAPVSTLTPVDPKSNSDSGNPAQLDISYGANEPPAIVFGVACSRDGGTFSVQSPTFGAVIPNTANLQVGFTIYQADDENPVPDQSVDQGDNGRNINAAFYLAVS